MGNDNQRINGGRYRHAKLLVSALLFKLIFVSFPLLAIEANVSRLQRGEFLTGPSNSDAFEICRDYLKQKRSQKGLELGDIDELEVSNRVISKHNGLTHLYMRQKFKGIEVEGANYAVTVDRKGRMLLETDRLKRRLANKLSRLPGAYLNPLQALRYAALAIGESASFEITTLERAKGPMKASLLRAPDLSLDDIPVQLNFVESDSGELRRAWRIVIHTRDSQHWWNLFIDASTGELLKKIDWVAKESYEVYPLPFESPSDGPRTIVSGVADPVASPFGWHDTNGVPGAELQDTRGNNVFAQEDADGDNAGGLRPDGGPSLDFLTPINPQLQPSANFEAATLNLFYWNNIMHDVLYQYGFDEAAGNFQQNNYAKGGIAGDPVQADSQDGTGVNNATFGGGAMGTPPDGTAPRMTMFLWIPSLPSNLEITSPQSLAGNYTVGDAGFGAWTNGLSGEVVLGLDDANAAGPTTTDGCTSFTNGAAVAGKIALVDRGECFFVEKTANAQAAGAIGVIIANNAGDEVIGMGGQDPSLSIPALFIGQSDGAALKAELATGVNATMSVVERRDSAFDNGIIAHEYGHGLTMRLTGGAGNSSCLSQTQSSGMGEGWSDWLALTMTSNASDSPIIPRPVGAFANSGGGIRNYPYTRDLGINPLTFANVANLNQPHGVGEVWASALWDLYWNLIAAYGYDPDFYHGGGGNNRLMQLVIDGLKLQPCNPTFVEARDSIITADLINNAGANQCLIWEAFARRGMGVSAVAGSAGSVAVTEAFDLPASCAVQCGNNVLDIGEQCDDGNNLPFDGCASNCRTESALQELSGNAQGGQLNLILAGVGVELTTVAGQSADAVATALVAAINNNSALQAVSGIAANDGGQIVVTGTVAQFEVNDAGLLSAPVKVQVPVQLPWRVVLVMLAAGLFVSRLSTRRTYT